MNILKILPLLLLLSLAACGNDDGGAVENEEEVINEVTLTLTPVGGGAPVSASSIDPDGDGGAAPTIATLTLTAGVTYTMGVIFRNTLGTEPEDITTEVLEESDVHQVFYTGSAVMGPASASAGSFLVHAYSDTDAGGAPVGLSNTLAAAGPGSGELTVTLRHLPPINDAPVKTPNLASLAREGGFESIAGENDVQVTFPVTVLPLIAP